ncbi:MAG: hypothetical protein WA624_17280 [Methylocella sp.]
MAASDGRGFVASQDEMVGGTRKGKLLLSVGKPATAALIVPADGDYVAVIGENRKLLIFPLAQLPEMARGKGDVPVIVEIEGAALLASSL